MVCLRGFSFTDDSANVTTPNQRMESSATDHLLSHNVGPALQMSRLRRIQSSAYQQLFQASRPALEDVWELMSTSIKDMHRWHSELTDQTKRPIKNFFRGDLLFSSILIMSPTGLVESLNDYGKFLIFEYTVEYAELVCTIGRDPDQSVLNTSHDMSRATFVAKRFLTLLNDDSGLLFSDILPQDPLSPRGRSPALPLPLIAAFTRGVGEMAKRAHACLDLLEKALEGLGSKTGNFSPLNEFKANSRLIRQSLPLSGYITLNSNVSSEQSNIKHESAYW